MNLNSYQTIVFDCDGVVLKSNKIKTQAFYDVAKVYGHEAAQALKEFHVNNGGLSRYIKFEYLLAEILGKTIEKIELQGLLDHFARQVKKSLLTCDVAEGLAELRNKTRHAKWLIVSGGDQAELRAVFAERELDQYFNGGIFGSPDTKETILNREKESFNIIKPAIFLGDSKYDNEVSSKSRLDFVFISNWTEVADWRNYCALENLVSKPRLIDLL